MVFSYKKFVSHLTALGKRREAGFIRKFYIEHKTRKQIIKEMYMNSIAYYYSVKRKSKALIEKNYTVQRFLDKA